ncbi:putative CDK5 regulatory subunit-associated protein 3 [Monocercomonoides exilis]|uniref:putative CDK5 regulatory subunit-associated protein 3 n=1 Tax=Monocercomonoides exilis TaxID=2049356 RepID=UPI003559A446|nr:putative CDK5 regulatory subunit-associated protein 3 [Monocercomonoides exilis]|eukprot:MONOS_10664.1-p1 / transcript=MONOS_10664.1 / gene=MONOS_10664 / organism=Monocercomonoides_exilis_PA203 / gene_product= CDK5RAP3, UFL1 substrate adaptor / transcript_product= CDK5RAP3, UFL1 substrate adaptor / location=Mono_scaffold00493:13318-15769(-) / protein_length=590 / sequence_SO=supercontig / SO=protein_coding / is_pseudo=false
MTTLSFDLPDENQPQQTQQSFISFDTLFAYFVDKKVLNASFVTQSKNLTTQIKSGFQALPDEIRENFDDKKDLLHFWNCEAIFNELMKRPNSSKKDFFGRYVDPEIKKWNNIMTQFQKNNLHIGHAAQILARTIQLDLPGIRKGITRYSSEIDTLVKKRTEQLKSAAAFQKEFDHECALIHAKGSSDLSTAIKAQSEQIPSIIAKYIYTYITTSSSFIAALKLYEKFSKQKAPKSTKWTERKMTKEGFPAPLSTLYCVMALSESFLSTIMNEPWKPSFSSTKEERASPTPLQKSASQASTLSSSASASSSSSSASASSPSPSSAPSPSPSPSSSSSSSSSGDDDIDWGDFDDDLAFSYDVEEVDDGASSTGASADSAADAICVVEEGTEEVISPKTEEEENRLFLAALGESSDRNALHRDILEIKSFIEQRIVEASSSDHSTTTSIAAAYSSVSKGEKGGSGGSSGLDAADVSVPMSTLKQMQTALQKAIEGAKEKKLEHLILLKNSPSYVLRLVSSIQTKKDSANRMTQQAKRTSVMIEEAQRQVDRQNKILADYLTKIRNLATCIEQSYNKLSVAEKKLNIIGIPTK